MKNKDMREIKIGVLMGGSSSEREISLKTGRAIEEALKSQGLQVIGIDVDGCISQRLIKENIQVAFLALHGKYGEDGSIQGLLEMLKIPYTGSNVLASALAFHKVRTKTIFTYHHIPTPRFISLGKEEDFSTQLERVKERIWGYPLVVKPAQEGSTIGVSLIGNEDALEDACRKAFNYSQEILIEEYIEGREIAVGILDDQALPIVEVVPLSGFYDYESKYTIGKTEYIIPAPLKKEVYQKVQSISLRAHKSLGCKGVSRVDLRLDKNNNPYVLEVNTIPGMTQLSLLPKAAGEAGISFEELVKRILLSALRGE